MNNDLSELNAAYKLGLRVQLPLDTYVKAYVCIYFNVMSFKKDALWRINRMVRGGYIVTHENNKDTRGMLYYDNVYEIVELPDGTCWRDLPILR